VELEPQDPGKGFEFENKTVGGSVPKEYVMPIQKGIVEAMENGVIAGYPMVDIKVTLIDGSYHDVDSSEMAFKIAGSMAFKEGANKASPTLLEPIMAVEVVCAEEYMGDIIGDLSSPPRPRTGDEHEGRGTGHHSSGAALRDVRLCHGYPVQDPGACHVYDAVCSL